VRFSYASLLVRIRSGLLLYINISNIDFDDRSCSLSSSSGPSSPSPAKNLFDQPQDDGDSNRGEEGCVDSELMFIRLTGQLIHGSGLEVLTKYSRPIMEGSKNALFANPTASLERMNCSFGSLDLSIYPSAQVTATGS
jgi:hypothetical protein